MEVVKPAIGTDVLSSRAAPGVHCRPQPTGRCNWHGTGDLARGLREGLVGVACIRGDYCWSIISLVQPVSIRSYFMLQPTGTCGQPDAGIGRVGWGVWTAPRSF